MFYERKTALLLLLSERSLEIQTMDWMTNDQRLRETNGLTHPRKSLDFETLHCESQTIVLQGYRKIFRKRSTVEELIQRDKDTSEKAVAYAC